MNSDTYVLGTDTAELERLGRQHVIWQSDTLAAWDRAGFGPGQRLLDLGCGPGFATRDLAERVGPAGAVLAIDNAPPYLRHLEEQAGFLGLAQIQTLEMDLTALPADPHSGALLGSGTWDGAWCRWLAMFLSVPEALIELVCGALRPGGRLVLHEYVQWNTFALYPQGEGVARFVQACIRQWQAAGCDPDIAARLPRMLAAQGLRLLGARSLMACEPSSGSKARWLQDFLSSYPSRLEAAGLWSGSDQALLSSDLERAMEQPSLWVTPAVVEQIWEKPGTPANRS